MKDTTEPRVETFNHARTGLFILFGIAVAGLVLLLVAQARGGPVWMFNAFLLASIGTIALYLQGASSARSRACASGWRAPSGGATRSRRRWCGRSTGCGPATW